MKQMKYILLSLLILTFLGGCIATTNDTVDGGTPDVTECSPLDGVLDGADFIPKSALSNHEADDRTHPDIFYIAWAQLNDRIDLRFPSRGYNKTGFEDKLLVSRKERDGSYKTWQIYPSLDNECQDIEKVRIHSFDVAPDGRSLYISISKPVFSPDDLLKENNLNPKNNLGIFKLDIASKKITPITHNYNASYIYPTYIGDDNETKNEMLLISKTVTKNDIPLNYKFSDELLLDEYDRAATPLIHKLDSITGITTLLGFNNSHQTEPLVINRESGTPLVVFTQWEHQARVNRFALWKMQIDGSDNFSFYGDESSTKDTDQNLYQAREVKSGPYKGYILMGQAARTGRSGNFISEGDILMTKRSNLDLRSDKVFLSNLKNDRGVQKNIARAPEHYNDESFVYAYRPDIDSSYGLYVKDYPSDLNVTVSEEPGEKIIVSDNYHFTQARSFYPPLSEIVAPGVLDLSENRVSFTNTRLYGKSGFLVHNIAQSDNGVQHQLDGVDSSELSMQFFIPSHTFRDSFAKGLENSQEMSIPSSGFIKPESDGSMGVILKNGLYVWKINKKFPFVDGGGEDKDLWIPIRVERQEVSFVPNRVNACNQCHQERSQENLDKYENFESIAQTKMQGDLADVVASSNDISDYNASYSMPDYHKNIAPLFTKAGLNGGLSCADCHNAKDKLNLANMTGVDLNNATYRNVLLGAHKMPDSERVIPYLDKTINPMGMDNNYHPAPFLWSLLLNDDLTMPGDENHSAKSTRNLDRAGDYGAVYDKDIEDEIARINGIYDHSKHWSGNDMQNFIVYGSTRIPLGLSDRITFNTNYLHATSGQAQKAYQSLVRNCYECHSNHSSGGMNDRSFEDVIPLEKRYISGTYLSDRRMRFVIKKHLRYKDDTKYSQYIGQSYLNYSMSHTLSSALYRIDFNDLNNSELLVYARGYYKDKNGTQTPLNSNIKAHSYLSEGDTDYITLENWLNGVTMVNQSPVIDTPITPIVIKEYDEPAYLEENITWHDPDENELSQIFIAGSSGFNDTMLALEYRSLISADLKSYAILGDRGDQNFTFSITDGLTAPSLQKVPVTVTSDYVVPRPSSTLPTAYLFFVDRETRMLKKLYTTDSNETNASDFTITISNDNNNSESNETNITYDANSKILDIGIIEDFNQNWTTMYRRSDKGWLYFVNQAEQKIYVVDERDASILFDITLDHESNKETTSHKQTVYLIWWRQAEGNVGDDDYKAGEIQGLLESKLSDTLDGDWYVSLGNGEEVNTTIIPEYRTRLRDGANTLGVYVWRRATFMTKWANEGIDRMNVLNLVTGKAKSLNEFSFFKKTVDGVEYNANKYFNVRALVVAEDGAFYGFNKDLNKPVETFNFDPIENIQRKVDIPSWIQTYIDNYQLYATPFLVIEPREKNATTIE